MDWSEFVVVVVVMLFSGLMVPVAFSASVADHEANQPIDEEVEGEE